MTTHTNYFRRIALSWAFLVILLSSCTTSKSLMKDGMTYQSSGLHEEAVKAYKASLSKRFDNSQSRIGLNESGQYMLNKLLDEFNRNVMLKRSKEAVYAFKDAEIFVDELKKYNVDLRIADHYYQSYVSSEDTYLSARYDAGLELLENESFEDSKRIFDEILTIHPGYRDVESLKGTSVIEPKYRRGLELEEAREYRQAYWLFDEITRNLSYKDASERKADCLEKGRFVLAVLPFEDKAGSPTTRAKVQAYSLNALTSLENPFLRVVDRQNMDQILSEQNFSLSGVINETSAIEVGNITGAQAILVGELIEFKEEVGQMRRQQVNGYESYDIKVKGEDGQESTLTRYKPVTYNRYYDRNSVQLSFHVKMISLETAEVLFSDVMEKDLSDEVEFISYNGNSSRLFPDNNGKPDISRGAVNQLRTLINGRTELSSTNEIANNAIDDIGRSLASKVDDFLYR